MKGNRDCQAREDEGRGVEEGVAPTGRTAKRPLEQHGEHLLRWQTNDYQHRGADRERKSEVNEGQ